MIIYLNLFIYKNICSTKLLCISSIFILNTLVVLHEISAKNALKRVYDQNEKCDIVVTELDNLDVDAYGFLEHMTKIAPVVGKFRHFCLS